MNRIDRLFGILTMLQSKKYVPAEKIAEKFGISIRTVYRDIKAIGEQGVPLGFEQGKGYYVMQGYFLPPVSFTTEEANALLLMEAMVGGFADLSIKKHYSSALGKVKTVLRHQQKEKLEFLDRNIKFHLPECFMPDYAYLSKIQAAIAGRTILEIAYENKEGIASRRRVEPIGLVFYAFAWHLIGWCHHRKDYRDFRVSRIKSMVSTDLPFLNESLMDLNDYVKLCPIDQ
ncbi:YafY family transcriptional regulator [Flavihumibacter rivuli]|uniref:helix-turn-helix transcriptional regulator n=1 Tax=Flavihumibacter rivuli TaxID=2838156 RepID=UPI001BDE86DA|nr:YafY family protein [Flavihumibacter rivuli]ULQ55933.1 YafY family transcriptional regulator [Flavihumibacter rivuli]